MSFQRPKGKGLFLLPITSLNLSYPYDKSRSAGNFSVPVKIKFLSALTIAVSVDGSPTQVVIIRPPTNDVSATLTKEYKKCYWPSKTKLTPRMEKFESLNMVNKKFDLMFNRDVL